MNNTLQVIETHAIFSAKPVLEVRDSTGNKTQVEFNNESEKRGFVLNSPIAWCGEFNNCLELIKKENPTCKVPYVQFFDSTEQYLEVFMLIKTDDNISTDDKSELIEILCDVIKVRERENYLYPQDCLKVCN